MPRYAETCHTKRAQEKLDRRPEASPRARLARLDLNAGQRRGRLAAVQTQVCLLGAHDLRNGQQRAAQVLALEIAVLIAAQSPARFSSQEHGPFGLVVNLAPGGI